MSTSARLTWSLGLVLALGLLVMPTTSEAQDYGGFRGRVTDATGAVMVGVTISATEEEKGLPYSAVTNEVGNFELRGIIPGTYTIEAETTGFKKYTNTGVIVYSAQVRRVDITMEIGELADVITVTEEGARVDTDTPAINYKTPDREVYFRNIQASIIYTAGLSPGSLQRNEIHGTYSNNTAPTQDGILTHAYGFFRGTQEMLQEVNQVTMNAPAEYQHANNLMGVGKGGQNAFHGEMMVEFNHQWLRAGNRAVARRPKPEAGSERYSYELSGPVWIPKIYDGRNKTFWHFLYTPRDVTSIGINPNLTYPTRRMRTGDLTEFVPFTPDSQITNPYTGQPFANNIIPRAMWHQPFADNILALLPVPERPTLVNNHTGINVGSNPNNWTQLRIDHQITEDNTITFNHFRFNQDTKTQKWDHGPFDCGRNQLAGTRAFSVQDSHVFSPAVINEFSLSWNEQRKSAKSGCPAAQLISQLGPVDYGDGPGVLSRGGRQLANTVGSPRLFARNIGSVGGSATGAFNPRLALFLGGGLGGESTNDETRNLYLKNNMSVNKANHLIKLGFSNLWGLEESTRTASTEYGNWDFTGNFTGSDFGDILLGLPYTTSIGTSRGYYQPRSNQFGIFLQDDWKVTPELTLNLGIRFQHYSTARDLQNKWYNFDLATLSVVIPDQSANLVVPGYPVDQIPVLTASDAGYPPNLFDFKTVLVQPRLGFAYRLNDRTVLRGGFGVYHVPLTPPDDTDQALAGFNSGPFQLTESFGPNEIINGVPQLTALKPLPAPGTGAIPLQNVNMIQLPTRKNKWPVDMQWNLTMEREMGNGLVGRTSYVATKGTHWPYNVNLQIPPASTVKFSKDRRPYGAAPFQSIDDYRLGGNQTYHAFEAELTRQFSSGLYVRSWYEYRTVLNDVQGGLFGWVGPGGFATEDPFDRSRDKGRTNGISIHAVRAVGVYDLPLGRGQKFLANSSGVIQQLVGNWTIAPEYTLRAKASHTPTYSGADPANVGRSGGRASIEAGCEPNGFGSNTDPPGIIWNRGCFSRPADGTYGTAARGVLYMARSPNFRINVFKTFPLTKFENGPYFKLEAYITNPLNHTNPSGPGSINIASPSFGLYRATSHTRNIAFRLRLGF